MATCTSWSGFTLGTPIVPAPWASASSNGPGSPWPRAQQTVILPLEEPTTFLGWGYQLEVLELLRRLNKTRGLTVVMALRDLNQVAQFADQVAVLATGRLQGLGAPEQVIDETLLARIFRVRGTVTRTEQGHPLCIGQVTVAD